MEKELAFMSVAMLVSVGLLILVGNAAADAGVCAKAAPEEEGDNRADNRVSSNVSLSSTTIYVPDNYPTIQAAVNAASGGDTIIVRDGIYNESVRVGRRVTIQSENGSANCIVNVSGSYYAFIIHSSYVNINGFTIKAAFTGIGIGTNFCNISNNNILLSNYTYYGYGIKFGYYSNNNTIIGNTFDGYNMSCYYGIYLDKTNDNLIKDNHISNCTHGIYASDSTNNTIIGNMFEKCGIFIAGGVRSQPYISHIIEDNIVNGKPIYYYKNTEGITVPEDAGQVIVVNCSNMTIRNINASSATVGIIIAHCSNMTIRNINASSATGGIQLIVTGSSIVENNTCNNNDFGIDIVSLCRVVPDNNIITKNTCNFNRQWGIRLMNGAYNYIENNNCSNTYYYGHYSQYGGHGIYVYNAPYNNISNNICSNNCGAGIYLYFYHKISKNNITKNTVLNNYWGIYLEDSEYNTIYLNNFMNNSRGSAYGSTSENVWNSTTKLTYIYAGENYTNYMGNYWDGYGADVDGDGIGDGSYGFDDYPLMQPFELYFPAENQPPTASFTYSPKKTVVNQAITFDASASSDPDGDIVSTEWKFGDGSTGSGKVITHSYSSQGNYTVTLTVTDDRGAKKSTSKIITVYSTTAIFDTYAPTNPYPSISGTHNGTIKPNQPITVNKLYTYPCPRTGGHTESIVLYDKNNTLIANGTWNGYESDWHNITIQNVTGASYVTLLENHEYSYTIITGSYPQIHHTANLSTSTGFITCSEFVDANGKKQNECIPAIRLWAG